MKIMAKAIDVNDIVDVSVTAKLVLEMKKEKMLQYTGPSNCEVIPGFTHLPAHILHKSKYSFRFGCVAVVLS